MRLGCRQSAARSPPRVSRVGARTPASASRAEIAAHSASLAVAVHGKSYMGRTAISVSLRSRRSPVPAWMNRAVVGCEEIASRHVEIAVVDKAAVALDQGGAIEAVEFRDLIPGQPAAQVMRRMQVVEQEKRTENSGVLDYRGSLAHLLLGAMLGEGADHSEAHARIDKARDIDPERHAADADHPDENDRAFEEVARDDPACVALAPPGVASQAANETRDRPGRTEHHAAQKRRLRGNKGAAERPESAPLSVRPVIALGIIERIGQVLVPMMGKVGGAVDRIRQPYRQRPATDHFVDGAIPGGMAVNGLVLQVQLPGDNPGPEPGQAPPWQIAVEICRQQP